MITLLGILTGNGLVAFLICLLVIAVIAYGLKLLLAEFGGLSPNIRSLIWLIFAVVAILYLLNRFAGINI